MLLINRRIMIFIFLICLVFAVPSVNGQALAATTIENENAKQDTAALYNNLANIYFIESAGDSVKLDTAILYYKHAWQLDPQDAGIVLNLALAYLALDDTLMSDSLFGQAVTMLDTSAQKAAYLLKIKLQNESEYGTAKVISTEEVKFQLKKAESKKKKKKPKKKKKVPTRRGGPKSVKPEELQRHLYYKK